MEKMAEYATVSYWNERYTIDTEPFEWYITPNRLLGQIKEKIESLNPPFSAFSPMISTLIVGVGNSTMATDIYQSGFAHIVTAIDWSSCAIETQLRRLHAEGGDVAKAVKYIKSEAKSLSDIASNSVDLIIDKGTLDCIFCGDDHQTAVQAALTEWCRVLRPDGLMCIVSHSETSGRLGILAPFESLYDVEWTQITMLDANENSEEDKPYEDTITLEGAEADLKLEHCYLYTCRKKRFI